METQTAVTSTLAPEEEYARFDAARLKAQEQLGVLYDKALEEVGEDNASIFEIHLATSLKYSPKFSEPTCSNIPTEVT
ncbi:phosphoenolpyruvate-utilizing N-terminal domain-containing protein [Lactobacillus taiwanensis]|uniref:phosphoenolpyruvate-utilizing N-terminal domain-containing protein n=1 Tax=Lactobacillus taiwanensis TaxID=508451 RepID=UPI00336BC3B6